MRYALAVLIFLVFTAVQPASSRSTHASPAPGACTGQYRWPIKTLSDSSSVDFAHPNGSFASVGDLLRSLSRPSGVDGMTAARASAETHVYRIRATVVKYHLEPDQDYHVVLMDDNGGSATMVSEIPDPKCVASAAMRNAFQFGSLRSKLLAEPSTAGAFQWYTVNKPATITGVLFFDMPGHGSGADPIGAELHPIIAIDFGGGAATPSPTPSVQPTPSSNGRSSPPTGNGEFATEAAARDHCPGETVAWVNTRSRLYHLQGSRWYGTTLRGAYMCQKDADAQGFQNAFE